MAAAFRMNNVGLFWLLLVCVTATTRADSSAAWKYKFAYTTNINSQMSVECGDGEQIWIGWSHYGTRDNVNHPGHSNSDTMMSIDGSSVSSIRNTQLLKLPAEHDCWMNFTEKIAEQCNGESPRCDISSQPTYIHKCGKISDYLYVAFRCIRKRDTFDICTASSRVFRPTSATTSPLAFYLKSSDFPIEYPSSLDCSCLIDASADQQLKFEVLWFSLQDNDYVNLFGQNLSGWVNPTHEWPVATRTNTVRFLTDDSLAYKGFWLKVTTRRACPADWQLVGDSCVKVFSEARDWRAANQQCTQMSGYLLRIDDVVSDLKLTQHMKAFYPEISSYWIGLRKYADASNQARWMWSNNSTLYNDVSWWPWRRNTSPDNTDAASEEHDLRHCVTKRRNEDGFFATSCEAHQNKHSFVCQTETLSTATPAPSSYVSLQCGSTASIRGYHQLLVKEQQAAAARASAPATSREPSTQPHFVLTNDDPSMISEIFRYEPSRAAQPKLVTKQAQATRPPYAILNAPEPLFIAAHTNDDDSQESVKPAVKASSTSSIESNNKLNTTVLAGIISGVGFVIVLINIGILFICRRNLKKLIKNSKEPHSVTRDGMMQEYFEAFNTMNGFPPKPNVGINATALQQKHVQMQQHQLQQSALFGTAAGTMQHQMRTSSNSSGDDFLLNESAQLFYNNSNSSANTNTMHQGQQVPFTRDTAARNSSSAFKPFAKDGANNEHINSSHQMLISLQQHQMLMQQQQNQYDKMNHHLVGTQNSDSVGQYAHTYESLDVPELPNRWQVGRGGYPPAPPPPPPHHATDLLVKSPSCLDVAANGNSPNSNISSTSSTASSSGASSTHQFFRSTRTLKQNSHSQQQQLDAYFNKFPSVEASQHHPQAPFGHQLLIQSTFNPATAAHLQQQYDQQFAACCNGGEAGSWSPDSAYYSSIPTLAAYTSSYGAGGTATHQLTQAQIQQLLTMKHHAGSANFSLNAACSNGESFKSHLV